MIVYDNPERRVNVREAMHDPFKAEYYKKRWEAANKNIQASVEGAREAPLEKSQQQGE